MEKLKVSLKNLNPAIKKATAVIKKGGVVVCPTDTVYGLVCDAKNQEAVEKLLKIKKRPEEKPVPVFVKSLKMAKSLAIINQRQEKFLKRVWLGKGKLTAVLKARARAKKIFPKGIVCPKGKIGLRIPNYKILNILLKKLNIPLTATSANISGKPASTKIKEILRQFKEQKHKPDLILDAGNLKPSLSSTVVDLENFKILRKGQISKTEILNILKEIKNEKFKK